MCNLTTTRLLKDQIDEKFHQIQSSGNQKRSIFLPQSVISFWPYLLDILDGSSDLKVFDSSFLKISAYNLADDGCNLLFIGNAEVVESTIKVFTFHINTILKLINAQNKDQYDYYMSIAEIELKINSIDALLFRLKSIDFDTK